MSRLGRNGHKPASKEHITAAVYERALGRVASLLPDDAEIGRYFIVNIEDGYLMLRLNPVLEDDHALDDVLTDRPLMFTGPIQLYEQVAEEIHDYLLGLKDNPIDDSERGFIDDSKRGLRAVRTYMDNGGSIHIPPQGLDRMVARYIFVGSNF